MGVPLPALNSGNTLYITVYINFYRKSSPLPSLRLTLLRKPYTASERVIWGGLVLSLMMTPSRLGSGEGAS